MDLEPFGALYNDVDPIYQNRAFFVAGGHTGYTSNQVVVGDKARVFYDGSSIYVLRVKPSWYVYEFIEDGICAWAHGWRSIRPS
jgi:hypothetical protein